MSQINITNLTFAYEGSYDNIFENANIQLDTDWKLGFISRNGKGKTTLLNLLLDKYEYKGNISKSATMEYFPYPIKDKTQLTINIVEQIYPNHVEWELFREINLLKISIDTLYRPFDTLSSGEQTKILLAILFLKENCFLLIDEPTNHLDINARETVSEYLNSKNGFILVSHDRAFLDNCIDHILSINKNNIEIQQGNFTSWYKNKQLQDNFEMSENKKLKSEIVRLDKTAKQKSSWSNSLEKTKYHTKDSGLRPDRGFIGAKSAKMMKRAKAIKTRQQLAIDEKSKLLKNIDSIENLKLSQSIHYKKQLINFINVSTFYQKKSVFENLNFTVNKGDRVVLHGINGSGKSTILKLICGQDIDYTGSVEIAPNLKISYVFQDASILCGNLTEYAKQHNIDESLFKTILRKLDFSRVQFEKDISYFSGGQKKKVLIAKSLCESPHIHIWDEPLNFIDVLSRIQIECLLNEYNPTLLFVEHDKLFCDNIANKIVNL